MKNIFYCLLAIITIGGCRKEPFDVATTINPNAPSAALYLNGATLDQINQLGIALQSVTRSGYTDFIRNSSSVGREVISSTSTDNRYFTELLGTQVTSFPPIAPSTVGTNDPTGIFNGYYSSYSQTRRRALNFTTAANNTTVLSAQQKAAIAGFSLTIQAYVTLNLLNMQGTNGIRETFTDLAASGDLLKPGKFGTYTSGLVAVKKMVDDGLAALNSAGGTAFPFMLNSGYTANGISSVADFAKFNRAIAARVAMYQQDWAGMLSAINASFYSASGTLTSGPRFIFSTAPNDFSNTLYAVPNSSGSPYVAFENFITDAEAGDTRVFGATAKIATRTAPRQSGAFTSTSDVVIFNSNIASAPIIDNEELILMFAEASAQTNGVIAAVSAINKIRTSYGLAAYTGLVDQPSLINEILKQRRYSLFFKGHRWFDMRRYNRLAQIQPQGTISGNSFVVFTTMARPDAEVQWDKLNP